MGRTKVLIVDDSALVRQMLSQILSRDPEIEVIGTAMDPIFAMQKIMRQPPDVITLDVEMPRMDGLTFLQKLMASYPIPVLMISSFTQKGCDTTLKALELGAVDFIAKPDRATVENLTALGREITAKVKNAVRVNLKVHDRPISMSKQVVTGLADQSASRSAGRRKLVAIGASTGGVSAVCGIIETLVPADYSILVALHMPAGFTKSFAERLGSVNGWKSKEAVSGQPIMPGNIYVAPGGHNMTVEQVDGTNVLRVRGCEQTDIFKPNINKTFASVAKVFGAQAIGIILTGMGDDGARGLLTMKEAGAATIAQSEETCMVYGMPKKAIEAGGVDYIVPLGQIPAKITQLI